MRTNIDPDDVLVAEAMAITGLSTEKATIEEALRRLIRSARPRRAIEAMHGMGWEGDSAISG